MIGCMIIHGYTGGPYEIEPLARYLRENTNFIVEVPTLPGHGKKLALDDVSYEDWLKTAEDTFLQLKEKTDQIYLIGFSMGGMIASYLAGKYTVNKLVLLATAGKYLSFKQIGLDVGSFVKDRVTGKLDDNKLFQHYKSKRGEVPLKANIEFMKLVKKTRKYLGEIENPVLIVQGQMDGMVPYQTAYYLDEEIPSEYKEVVLFNQSKHLICLGNDKDVLNSMVHEFLSESSLEHPMKEI